MPSALRCDWRRRACATVAHEQLEFDATVAQEQQEVSTCAELAESAFQRCAWWEAIVAADRGVRDRPLSDPAVARMMLIYGVAALRLGMLGLASEQLEQAALLPPSEMAPHFAEIAARQAAIDGDTGVENEIEALRRALGDTASDKWEASVLGECGSPTGWARLHGSGMLPTAEAPSAAERRRAVHRMLLYQTKRRLQLAASQAEPQLAGTSGGRYRCVPPRQAAARLCPGAPPLLAEEELQRLEAERVVVVDAALDAALVARAAREVAALREAGALRTDADELCNPLQLSHDVPLWEAAQLRGLDAATPALAACVRRLFGLPLELERRLGLSLRVPQTVMLAAYPPRARYRRHLDSYGGKDIPRLVTALLYLEWAPRKGGQLRVHGAAARSLGGGAGAGAGVRDIAPLPGRLVLFFSQEVEHEVLESVGDRTAITLWIWSTTPDDHGR